MLSSTFTLGAQDHFNNMLDVKGSKFTYLVPSNEAWENIQGEMASTWKVLFNGDFGYQTKQILERHLKIGEALSVEQLVQKTKDDGGVRMLRGFFDLRFKEADDGEGLLDFELEISIN